MSFVLAVRLRLRPAKRPEVQVPIELDSSVSFSGYVGVQGIDRFGTRSVL